MAYSPVMTSAKALDVFFHAYPETKYARGVCFLCADEEPEGVYYVQSGFVRQYATRPGGEELNIHIYKPGSALPLMWLFNETSNRYFYSAMTDCVIRLAPRNKFMTFLTKHPELLEHFVTRLLLGMDGLLSRMESLVLDDAYTKTILLFAYLAKSFGRRVEGMTMIDVPLTHKQIASWIGTARETASLHVERLRKEKLITWRKSRYYIPDLRTLEQRTQRMKDTKSGTV